MSEIHLKGIEVRLLDLHLKVPHQTALGTESERPVVIVRLLTDATDGWGECAALGAPSYSDEYALGAWSLLHEYLVPELIGWSKQNRNRLPSPNGALDAISSIRGNPMAKAAVEMAVLDVWLRSEGRSLGDFVGAERDRVEAGAVIGLSSGTDLLESAHAAAEAGFRRVKIKVTPSVDIADLKRLREALPRLDLQVDANGSFDPEVPGHIETLLALDQLELAMIEQPLDPDDLTGHGALREKLTTPICLDESITSYGRLEDSIALGAADYICIKPSRLGGLQNAVKAHEKCLRSEIPVWCGGMLETAFGRSANAAIASLPGFLLPGDLAGGERFVEADPFLAGSEVRSQGPEVFVHAGPGVGPAPDLDALDRVTARIDVIPCA